MNLINWEWNTLKRLRKKRRRNILLRSTFTIFSLASILFCVFAPPFIMSSLFTAFGFHYYLVDCVYIISFLVWLWFIFPLDKLSKRKRRKRIREVELVKTV